MAVEITYATPTNFQAPSYEAYEAGADTPFALVWMRDGEWTAVESLTNLGRTATGATREEATTNLRTLMGLPL